MTANDSILVGLLHSQVRVEEKWLFQALEAQGVRYERIDDRAIQFNLSEPDEWRCFDAVLVRSISYSRGLYAARVLNAWGIPTLNSARVAEICGDKLATAAVLAAAGIAQPETVTAFTEEAALEAIERMGYPVVVKPPVGSWGRLLAKVNDRDTAEALLAHKTSLGGYQHGIFYIQKYIQKPGRDIRAIVAGDQVVAAIYRHSEHWITNTAREGKGEVCQITPALEEICLGAAGAVGGGVLAVDILEDPDRGYLVNEINHTLEFHTAAPTSGTDIPGAIIRHLVRLARGENMPAPGKMAAGVTDYA